MTNMKKKILLGILLVTIALCMCGCTQQTVSREYGGEMTIDLERGQKLEEITWKEDNLWILTKPMTKDDVAETHTFYESSEWGVWEGTVIVKEYK